MAMLLRDQITIREFFLRRSTSCYTPLLRLGYPSTFGSDHALANAFVNFFCEKIVNLRSSLNSLADVSGSTPVVVNALPPASCALSGFMVVTGEQLSRIICSTKINPCALDPVPASVLKECLAVLLPN